MASTSLRPTATWPAAELEPGWPEADPGLARWRYRRILSAIAEREEGYVAETLDPASTDALPVDRQQWEVLIAVPVPDGWRCTPGQTTIAAYGCVAALLSGEVAGGTVLASFPLLPLRREIGWRLRQLRCARRPLRETRTAA